MWAGDVTDIPMACPHGEAHQRARGERRQGRPRGKDGLDRQDRRPPPSYREDRDRPPDDDASDDDARPADMASWVELPLMNETNREPRTRKPTASTKPASAIRTVARRRSLRSSGLTRWRRRDRASGGTPFFRRSSGARDAHPPREGLATQHPIGRWESERLRCDRSPPRRARPPRRRASPRSA